jgi:translation initiation factor 1A
MKIQTEDGEYIRIPLPNKDENQMFAVVDTILGGSRMNVSCADGKIRLARIPGRNRRRLGKVRSNDLLIIAPWDIQDEKADIEYRYRKNQIRWLVQRDMLPEEVAVFGHDGGGSR